MVINSEICLCPHIALAPVVFNAPNNKSDCNIFWPHRAHQKEAAPLTATQRDLESRAMELEMRRLWFIPIYMYIQATETAISRQ